jgi:hypothetical protein
MSASSQLLVTASRYAADQTPDNAEVLFEAASGIPFLWFLCFGARNTYYPGVSIAEHGGAASERDRFETQIEDAQYRIEHVLENMRPNRYLWPWLSPLVLLERKLKARPKSHYLYLSTPAQTARGDLRRAISYAENAVNYISAGNTLASIPMLESLEGICPVVFFGDDKDRQRLAAAKDYASYTPEAARVALLQLGMPPRDSDILLRQAVEITTPELEALAKLPPPPPPSAPPLEPKDVPEPAAPKAKSGTQPYRGLTPTAGSPGKSRADNPRPAVAPKPNAPPAKQGLLEKLLGRFRK